ncbi:bacterioferritin-associated ferredoxin [Uliginosibacterium sp. sgz301328]|uniref:(2Fe-2S)-binding protein n=1 Tax=Uliginosibacterium sp. sgz301328 TaxID=3243764 RepID=UPI00359D7815
MIVCLCKGVSDHRIRNAIHNGSQSVDELTLELGVCSGCGCCRETCEDLISECSGTATTVQVLCAA